MASESGLTDTNGTEDDIEAQAERVPVAKTNAGRHRILIVSVAAVALAVLAGTFLFGSAPANNDPAQQTPTVLWEVQSGDVDGSPHRSSFVSFPGTTPDHRILNAADVLLVATQVESSSPYGTVERVHALDPDSGSAMWSVDLPGGACAEGEIEGLIACTRVTADSAGYELLLLDPANGDVVSSVAAPGEVVMMDIVND